MSGSDGHVRSLHLSLRLLSNGELQWQVVNGSIRWASYVCFCVLLRISLSVERLFIKTGDWMPIWFSLVLFFVVLKAGVEQYAKGRLCVRLCCVHGRVKSRRSQKPFQPEQVAFGAFVISVVRWRHRSVPVTRHFQSFPATYSRLKAAVAAGRLW